MVSAMGAVPEPIFAILKATKAIFWTMLMSTDWTNTPAKFAKQKSKKFNLPAAAPTFALNAKNELQTKLASSIILPMLERGAEQLVTTGQNTYEVSLDRGRFNMLLSRLGLEGDPSAVEVDLKPGRGWHGILPFRIRREINGQYCLGDRGKRIEIFLEGPISTYEENLNLAARIANGEVVFPWEEFSGLRTPRLAWYLRHRQVSPERGRQFAHRLLLNVLQRRVNNALLHEAQHAADYQTEGLYLKDSLPFLLKDYLVLLGFSIASLGSLAYSYYALWEGDIARGLLAHSVFLGGAIASYISAGNVGQSLVNSPIEKRARAAAQRHIRDPFWRQIIQIDSRPVDKSQK